MKAVAVYPGQPGSMREEVHRPRVTDVPDGRGVLVEVLRVRIDGTDREIDAAEFGEAPEGETSNRRGPFDVIFEAPGFSPIVFEAAEVLGKNGVPVLASITAGGRTTEVRSDAINQSFVLGNKLMVGAVNASHDDFVRGVDDLVKAEALHPSWLGRLLTTPVQGLESYAELRRRLLEDEDAIKVYLDLNGGAA
jgi:threonine dehydrogenase-like Zn-dependent dehydrogenase